MGLLWLKLTIKTIESIWAKGSKLGPGSNLTQSQIWPRSQYRSEHTLSQRNMLFLLMTFSSDLRHS